MLEQPDVNHEADQDVNTVRLTEDEMQAIITAQIVAEYRESVLGSEAAE